jgi:hypothetical protein
MPLVFNRICSWGLGVALGLVLFCAIGCDDTRTVSGTVTVGGAPLPSGHIGFAPAEGSGKRAGASITQGAYSVVGLPPGKYQVNVSGTDSQASSAPLTRETAAQQTGPPPKELIPASHPKNGQVVEVTSSTSTLDFDF